jgi:hypothetical protein
MAPASECRVSCDARVPTSSFAYGATAAGTDSKSPWTLAGPVRQVHLPRNPREALLHCVAVSVSMTMTTVGSRAPPQIEGRVPTSRWTRTRPTSGRSSPPRQGNAASRSLRLTPVPAPAQGAPNVESAMDDRARQPRAHIAWRSRGLPQRQKAFLDCIPGKVVAADEAARQPDHPWNMVANTLGESVIMPPRGSRVRPAVAATSTSGCRRSSSLVLLQTICDRSPGVACRQPTIGRRRRHGLPATPARDV